MFLTAKIATTMDRIINMINFIGIMANSKAFQTNKA